MNSFQIIIVFLLFSNKIKKNKKYNTAGTVPKSNRKIDKNRGKIDTLKGIMSLILVTFFLKFYFAFKINKYLVKT